MVRSKVTVTLDREKAVRAAELVGQRNLSQIIDLALQRLIQAEELRRDLLAYGREPLTNAELAITELQVEFDLDDDGVDYEALYGMT